MTSLFVLVLAMIGEEEGWRVEETDESSEATCFLYGQHHVLTNFLLKLSRESKADTGIPGGVDIYICIATHTHTHSLSLSVPLFC